MRAEKSKSDSRCDSRVVADLFRDESGFTTLGAALAILLSCSLLFFGLWTSRSLSRAAGVQAVVDSCALAAENEVSEFVLAVRAADATLLTLSLTGISLLGVGTVCCCVPGAQAAGLKFLDAGRAVLDKREDAARAEEAALNAAQKGLVVAAQAQAKWSLLKMPRLSGLMRLPMWDSCRSTRPIYRAAQGVLRRMPPRSRLMKAHPFLKALRRPKRRPYRQMTPCAKGGLPIAGHTPSRACASAPSRLRVWALLKTPWRAA